MHGPAVDIRDPAETPYQDVGALLTGHERRDGSWCRRRRGTPTPLLVHTLSGRGLLRAGGADHAILPGDTVLWSAGAPQEFGSAEPWEIVWAHFRPREHWREWLSWAGPAAGVGHISAPHQRLLARIEAALLEADVAARSAAPRAADLASNALERALLWLDAANPGPDRLDDRIHEAVLFVAHNLGGALSVSAIAEAVQLSPSRLGHLFKEQLGVSPARFVELRRIERAQTLLASSSMAIGAIAEATGFSSQFYFAARFRALTGTTPSEWRRQAASRGRSRLPDDRAEGARG